MRPINTAVSTSGFREELRDEFAAYLREQGARFQPAERLRIDLHCHDHNSDVPDELWGRILRLPETWLSTRELTGCLTRSGCDLLTITNHNNARSCWELLDAGHDVLVGAEFTCHFVEYDLYLHVLTYGFSPEQEAVLNRKRRDIYSFLRYTTECDLPVILPHPLYFYSRNAKLGPALFEKLALMFQRFEVLNGQRDVWQSMLVKNWALGLTEERLHRYSRLHRLDPADFGVRIGAPKVLAGGSDDHMGLSAGQSGSYLWVPDLLRRRQSRPLSELALEALRAGHIAPYGQVGENQRLSIALLDYFSQIATRIEDPGLLRLLLHRGETSDKLWCLGIANLLLEMKKHQRTQRFIALLHDALHGVRPRWWLRWSVSADYRFCLQHLDRIATVSRQTPERAAAVVHDAIGELFTDLTQLIIRRTRKCLSRCAVLPLEQLSSEALVRKFEIPTQLSALVFGKKPRRSDISGVNFMELLDKLSSPVMMSLVLAGSQMASTRVLYQNRRFLNEFAAQYGGLEHPRRALYLTDSLRDRNGVSKSLSGKLAEIRRRGYPVDFLICHADAQSEPHLHVVRPLAEFSFKTFGEQSIRIPDVLEIARIFYQGGYDRVVCSTEGPMVLAALFLKYMFNVPAFFFMHTDWLDFFKHTANLDQHERDRIRRVMRALYRQFEGVFVLNSDHRRWLTGSQMGLRPERVMLTAHHVEPTAKPVRPVRKSELLPGAGADTPVLFVASRISREKGVLELPEIYTRARQALPDLRLVIAGTGPAEPELRAALPEATFLGWVDAERMAELYAGLDLFVFPSKFDTFGNVILEAFARGMPVLAYNCKGPKDIVQDGVNGYLVNNREDMATRIIEHFQDGTRHAPMRQAATRRIDDYQAGPLMQQFMKDLGLLSAGQLVQRRAVA
jgi:glycosyltransferase involved in cell wall biosynthesis